MRFFAKSVSGTVCGDYYQFSLASESSDEESENDFEQTGSYLLLQTQFEFFSGGKCYVESDDEDYIGHFKLILIEFTPTYLVFEIARNNRNRVEVDFALTAAEFEESKPVVEVIFGLREPFFEDEF